VGIAPALPPVLSEEYIIESFLQDTIRALFVYLCLCTSYQSSIRCITYICHWLTPSTSYTSTQATSNPIYIHAQDVYSLVLAILTPGRGGHHRRWKCGVSNINTYSNRCLLTCARLRSTMTRP